MAVQAGHLNPYLVGIGGGSASGKSTLARHLLATLRRRAAILAIDQYYRDGSHLPPEARAAQNFDAPDAFDWALLFQHLDQLAAGKAVAAPVYDFTTHLRRPEEGVIPAHPIILIEGLHALSVRALRDRLHLKVFVDTPPDLCLVRRLRRDMEVRGRSPESVAAQYLAHVRPMYAAHVLPGRAHADLVVSGETVAASTALIAAAIRVRVADQVRS